jgi:hypothetical protein
VSAGVIRAVPVPHDGSTSEPPSGHASDLREKFLGMSEVEGQVRSTRPGIVCPFAACNAYAW